METKIPSEVETQSRDEMVCPNCFHDGLEAHPGYENEYEGDAEVLRATRCPNDDCEFHYGDGVPVDIVDSQYVRTSAVSGVIQNADLQTVLMGVLVVGGFAFLVVNVFGVGLFNTGSGGVDVTIAGDVSTADGAGLANVSLNIENSTKSVKTNQNGQYRLANLSSGEYIVSVEPRENQYAASTVTLNISDNGSVEYTSSNNATLEGRRLNIDVRQSERVSANGSVANETFLLSLSNPANANKSGGYSVTLSPPSGESVSANASVQSGTPKSINIPGVITSQSVFVDTGVVENDVSQSKTWTGEEDQLNVVGNMPPYSLNVNLSSDANVRRQKSEYNVTDGKTVTETIRGTLREGVTVTLWGGSANAPTTNSGTYDGNNPTVDIDEEQSPAQVSVELTGEQTRTERTVTGTISGGDAAFTLDGNLPIRDVGIVFTGGTPENSQVGSQSTSVDASDGPQSRQPILFTADSGGTYRVGYDFTTSRNPDLVTAGYKVDGELTTVNDTSGQARLNLAGGETVRLYLKAEQETNSHPKSYDPSNHNVRVTDTIVRPEQAQVGDTVRVTATMKNEGQPGTINLVMFKDGERTKTDDTYFGSGETKQVSFDTTFSSPGTHTLSVNEGQQVPVKIGTAEPRSGAGSLSATATLLGDGGTVDVDTDGDGTPDCSANANGGLCSLGKLPPGSHSVVVSQDGVTNTGFNITYDARFGAENVSVDIDSDGVPEIEQAGALADGEKLQGSGSVEAGINPILFNVGNGGRVPYEITYTESGQVTKPKLYIDGELAFDETENFKGERSYQVGQLSAGSHTFEFRSPNKSNEFNARISWTEEGDALYPKLKVDNEIVCEPYQFVGDGTCTINNPQSTETPLSIMFEGGANTFDYGVTYTARATPNTVTVRSNDKSIQYLQDALSSRNPDGSWTKQASTNLLTPGNNRISVSTTAVDGLTPTANARFTYTYRAKRPTAPVVTVTNGDGESFNKTVNSSYIDEDGYLNATTTLDLPANWFTRGENMISVGAKNQGVLVTEITGIAEHPNVLRLDTNKSKTSR